MFDEADAVGPIGALHHRQSLPAPDRRWTRADPSPDSPADDPMQPIAPNQPGGPNAGTAPDLISARTVLLVGASSKNRVALRAMIV